MDPIALQAADNFEMLLATHTHIFPHFPFIEIMKLEFYCKYAFVFCSSKRVRADYKPAHVWCS